jgi:hypothetical protein
VSRKKCTIFDIGILASGCLIFERIGFGSRQQQEAISIVLVAGGNLSTDER